MTRAIEKVIKMVYRKYKATPKEGCAMHPDEETFACFLDNRLDKGQKEHFMEHIVSCPGCSEVLEVQLKLKEGQGLEVPPNLVSWAKALVCPDIKGNILEVALRVKDRVIEILSTSGDILLGQEFVPVPVLRSRKDGEFRDEIYILKDFEENRVEIKVENKDKGLFYLTVTAKDKQTQKALADLRFTLIKGGIELESYFSEKGKAAFEHVEFGKYTIEISSSAGKLAEVMLDLRD